MALDLGQLAKKLLVNPIVSVGKAIGRDYKSTVYGPDWRERAVMRRRMAEARLAESASRVERDREETDYNRRAKEATASLIDERAAALRRKASVDEARARQLGIPLDEYLAQEAAKDDELRRSLRDAQIKYNLAGVGAREAEADKDTAWTETGLPAYVRGVDARAAASGQAPRGPVSPASRARLSSDVRDMAIAAHRSGKFDKLKSILSPYGRTALVNTFGEDSPIVAALAPAPDQ